MANILLAGTMGEWLDATFHSLDMGIFYFFGSIQNDFLNTVAKIFTALGSTKYVILIGVLALVLCFFKKTRRVGLSIVIALVIGTVITNFILKPIACRIRPYNTLQDDIRYWAYYIGAGRLSMSDFSFPSGHTTGAVELAVCMCLAHATSEKKTARIIAWIFPLKALLVGISRIYLMIHYPTDVFAGIIVGVIAGFAGWFIAKAVCNFVIRRRLDDIIDAGRLFKKGISKGAVAVVFFAYWLLIFAFAYLTSLNEGGAATIRCAYDGEYNCQNEAEVSSKKYPPINGMEYCKYHWKLITAGEIDLNEKTETITEPESESETETMTEPVTVNTDPVPNSDLFTFLNDEQMIAFRDNFDNNTPVKLETHWGNEVITTADAQTIRDVFEALKGITVGDVYTGDEAYGYQVAYIFIMPDESSVLFDFNNWQQGDNQASISWKNGKYQVTDANGIFDIWINNDAG